MITAFASIWTSRRDALWRSGAKARAAAVLTVGAAGILMPVAFGALDASPPLLVKADWLGSNQIAASFSHPVLPAAATNGANYLLTNTLGGHIVVSNAVLSTGTNVSLWTGTLEPDRNYVLTALSIPGAFVPANSTTSAVPVAHTIRLIAFENAWSFYDPFPPFDELDPGPDWKTVGYEMPAFGWGAGPGALGYAYVGDAPPPELPVPIGTPLSPTPGAAYFRQPFISRASPAGLGVKMRCGADDGAVVYLNGTEAWRFNMPAGVPSPTTQAAFGIGTASLQEAALNPALLRPGTNLVAVELHQIQPDDVDKYLALELEARVESWLDGPLVVLGGPHDAMVEEHQPVTFHVAALAASEFQWQWHGTNVPGATNATFTFRPALSFHGTPVRVLCGDGVTSLMSTSATLQVVPDLTPPRLVSACLGTGNTVVISFSESLAPASALNLAHYTVRDALGAVLPVTGAVLENETNVVLLVEMPMEGSYRVTASHVTDRSAFANAVVAGSSATVGANYLIGMESAWKYLLISTNQTVQATFARFDYDDSAWHGPSKALLFVEGFGLPARKNTWLSLYADGAATERINTYYFRQRFVTPITFTNVTMRLRHVIDDGMVLHLNGQEIYRYHMPTGFISAASQGTHVENAMLVGPIDVPITNLWTGTNVLAADVHQSGPSSGDIVFGVEVEIHVPSLVSAPTDLRIEIIPAGEFLGLRWNDPAFRLESAPTVLGPWNPMPVASPFFVTRTNEAGFYRLSQ